MSALADQIRHGAGQAWANLSEGWREMRARTASALTRFTHPRSSLEDADAEEGLPREGWGLMAADLRVDQDKLIVRIEAPGMDREDMHIDIDDHRLRVWGEKRVDAEMQDGDYQLLQCAYGAFSREVSLPVPVDADRAQASYRGGVLRIEIPRADRARGHRIAVQG